MLRRVELFEHETMEVGRSLRPDPEARLGAQDFEALVKFNDDTGQRFFRVGHQRITACQFVGYVEVGELAIEILPKADRDAKADAAPWRAGMLEMLHAATGLRFEHPTESSQTAGRSTLLHVVIARFLEEVETLAHQGLARGYRSEEQNGPVFRGKLLLQQQLRENLARDDRFFVRTTTYDRDIVVNRILRAALDALQTLRIDATAARRAAQCADAFATVTRGRVNGSDFDRLRLGRSTARYHDALLLARMILERRAPELRSGRAPVFALLFDMNVLWERYVAALFRKAAGRRFTVRTQEGRGFWRAAGSTERTVRPDIVVESEDGSVVLIADTKWKLVREGVPSDDDLKQMFVYNELFGSARSLLIYPTGGASKTREGGFTGRKHTCSTAHLGVLEGARWSAKHLEQQIVRLIG
ncbi:MAG: hypothetical protein HYV09_20715 [Deltaproteobacteria bacterium]|nr:hypothetical protein [Deltaproteobacteria bacterium]